MMCLEHPDVTQTLKTGYPGFTPIENLDTPENREDYIDEHATELIRWLRLGYPEILDEFIEFGGQACMVSYRDWLN